MTRAWAELTSVHLFDSHLNHFQPLSRRRTDWSMQSHKRPHELSDIFLKNIIGCDQRLIHFYCLLFTIYFFTTYFFTADDWLFTASVDQWGRYLTAPCFVVKQSFLQWVITQSWSHSTRWPYVLNKRFSVRDHWVSGVAFYWMRTDCQPMNRSAILLLKHSKQSLTILNIQTTTKQPKKPLRRRCS